jgi:hypothetical protein
MIKKIFYCPFNSFLKNHRKFSRGQILLEAILTLTVCIFILTCLHQIYLRELKTDTKRKFSQGRVHVKRIKN